MSADCTHTRERGFYLKSMRDANKREKSTPGDGLPLTNGSHENSPTANSSGPGVHKCTAEPNKVTVSEDADYSWMLCLNTEYLNYKKCRCQGCLRQFITFPSEKKHVERLIHAWTTLRNLIREVYLNPPIDTVQKNVGNILEEKEWIREDLQWLRMTEPYQLLQKIEDEVIAFVLESRTHLLTLINDKDVQAVAGEVFVTGLIEEYVKLLSSALYIAPLVEALLSPQLQKFHLTWEMLNKYLYLSFIYQHDDVKQMWPVGYHQLKRTLETKDHFYKQLFEQFMTLDREMDLVDETWKVIEPVITEYRMLKSRETAALKKLQAALKVRLSRKDQESGDDDATCVKGEECNQFGILPWPEFYRSDCLNSNHGSLDETGSSDSSCASDSEQSSRSPSRSPANAEDSDLIEKTEECECHVCSAHSVPNHVVNDDHGPCESIRAGDGEGFVLYPHIHDTSKCCPPLRKDNATSAASTTDIAANAAALDVDSHRPTRNNPYLLAEYSHLYSVLSNDINEERPSLILKALTGANIRPIVKERRKESNCSKTPICISMKENLTSEQQLALITEAVKSRLPKISIDDIKNSADCNDLSPESPKPEECSIDPENHLTLEEVGIVKKALQKRKQTVVDEKVLGKQKNGGGAGCAKSNVCGKCTKPGAPCNKSAEKHLAAIARLGMSKYSSKHTSRCSDHGKCRISEEPLKKCSSGTDCDWVDGDDGLSSLEDSCSERSNSTCTSNSTSTAQKDPKHCDCCYCEVFGHAVQTVTHVSRNYQETRERLRLRLNMKKKSKSNPQSVRPPGAIPETIVKPSSPQPQVKTEKEEDLDSLLQFIEGNAKNDIMDEKKSAKRARQKQKKQEEREEKERQEREAERLRLEALKKLSKKSKKAAKKEKQREAAAAAAAASAVSARSRLPAKSMPNVPLGKAIDGLLTKPGSAPKMVTIRRVMEPFNTEPTVTITIKGATPDNDKILYSPTSNQNNLSSSDKSSKKKKKKVKKGIEMDISDVPAVHQKRVIEIINASNKKPEPMKPVKKVEVSSPITKISASLTGAPKASNSTYSANTAVKPHVTLSNMTKSHVNLTINVNNSKVQPQQRHDEDYQIKSITQKVQEELKLENLRLPPGITITKIEAPQQKLIRASEDPGPVTKSTPLPPPIVMSHGAAPRIAGPSDFIQPTSKTSAPGKVIVVETSHLKQTIKENGLYASDNPSSKKKKKKKNKNNAAPICAPANDVEPVPLCQQATIIKTSHNMVTIRSPQLQRAIDMQSGSVNGVSERLQGMQLDAEGQLSQQMTRLTLADARASISAQQENKKKKKRRGKGSASEDDVEQPENVFEPKDIDLESGEMDDDEREVEAFKRFCLQSVPPARKDKVKVNLNIKDIVLKKKSSAIGCS